MAEAPLADGRGGVTAGLEGFGEGHFIGRQRLLAGELGPILFGEPIPGAFFLVVADRGVTEVLAGHQRAARRRAYRRAGVELREPHSFGGELVEVRRLDVTLAIAAELAEAEIVADDQDDVRRPLGG